MPKRDNPKTKAKKPKKQKKHPAIGMWKDRWPKDMSSAEIAKQHRKDQWKDYS